METAWRDIIQALEIKLIVPQYRVQENPVLSYVPEAQRKSYPRKAHKLSIETDKKSTLYK